jgi:hypothetical protein
MTTPKLPKPKCDHCGGFSWFLRDQSGRWICDECLAKFVAAAEVEPEPEEEPTKYPTPWRFDAANHEISRDISDDDAEVAMAFKKHGTPDDELLVLILGVMNGWKGCKGGWGR